VSGLLTLQFHAELGRQRSNEWPIASSLNCFIDSWVAIDLDKACDRSISTVNDLDDPPDGFQSRQDPFHPAFSPISALYKVQEIAFEIYEPKNAR
jgi:hypothetical protein